MTYKCTDSFTSSKNKSYKYGDEIDSYEYDRLTYREQSNFKKEDDSIGFGWATGDGFDTGIPGGLDFDTSTFI